MLLQQSFNFKKKCPSGVNKALLLARIRERLARESCQHKIKFRKFFDLINITLRAFTVVELIGLLCLLVNFRGQYTLGFNAQLPHGLLKSKPNSTNAGK